MRGLVEKLETSIGAALSASRLSQNLGWLVQLLLGFYYMLILSSIFLLAIQGVGLAYTFADKRIEAWQRRLRDSSKSGESNPRYHASRILRMVNRLFCNALVVGVLLLYFGIGFSVFPRTQVITGALREILGTTGRCGQGNRKLSPEVGLSGGDPDVRLGTPPGHELRICRYQKRDHCV